MFQLGLFTTHLPYILIIAFSAWAFLFKSAPEEETDSLCLNIPEHNFYTSCNDHSFLLRNIEPEVTDTTPTCKKQCFKQTNKNTISRLLFSPGEKLQTPYPNTLYDLTLSGNHPDRAPPAPLRLHFS
ncbi:hypothetical protein [Marinilabilia salmonicolor]|uniref:hypothetical protein n=1 Tax=Marinilabilia salmonicolor TaxID=989 RepID=UPI000DF47610|nr:hypothetical protein [Marinilabilia salmonicolor]